MAYSDDASLLRVAPLASSWSIENLGDDPSAVYSYHRSMAYADINNRLRGRTAIPVSSSDATVASGLSEVEARLTASRLVRSNLSKFQNTENATALSKMYEEDAKMLLDEMYFPASASTPVQSSTFTGDGTIAVTVNDSFAFRSTWTVKCRVAGLESAEFEIVNDRPRSNGPWSYTVSDGSWPSLTDIQSASASEALKAVSIVLTTGSTAWAVGDYFSIEVYPHYRINRKPGLTWIPLTR